MQAIEQYFHVVLFIMLHKVVLTFKSVDTTPVCDHSNASYWAVLSCGTVCYAVKGGSNFSVCGWKTFKSVDETLVNDHSNESYCTVLSCGTDYNAVQGGSNF